jgi:hypothetical protein
MSREDTNVESAKHIGNEGRNRAALRTLIPNQEIVWSAWRSIWESNKSHLLTYQVNSAEIKDCDCSKSVIKFSIVVQSSDYSDLRTGQGSSHWAVGDGIFRPAKENSPHTEKLLPADQLTTGMPNWESPREVTYAFRLHFNHQRFCARTLAVSG